MTANLRPKIIFDLGELDKLPIVTLAYSVGSLATLLLWFVDHFGTISAKSHHADQRRGQLHRKFDIRTLFCSAAVLFVVGTVVCGAAPNMNALIAGRVVSGIGGIGGSSRAAKHSVLRA